MNCPTCGVALTMSERQGIEIDYCPQCRGVWLDRGELDKIIERAGTAVAAPTAPRPEAVERRQPDERYHQDRYEDDAPYGRRKRRGNWLEDLFD